MVMIVIGSVSSRMLQLDVENFMVLQESLQPDLYEVITDDDTPKDAKNKRLQKSFERSLNFLDECIKRHEKSEVCMY